MERDMNILPLNYHNLSVLGTHYRLNFYLNNASSLADKSEELFEYVRYNPRRPIERYGLSITSLDGGMSGVPDLDSLLQYNKDNGTNIDDKDFTVKTPAYDLFKEVLDPFEPWLFRTHMLRLDPSGFFPPHRDVYNLKSFRLIVPVKNCNPPSMVFIADDKILHWNEGHMYFLDTVKMHYLFNMSDQPSYWLVLNVKCTSKAIEKVLYNLGEA